MHQVEIQIIKPGFFWGKTKSIKLSLPSSWNELSREGLLAFARHGLSGLNGQAKINLLNRLGGVSFKLISKLSVEQLSALTRLFDWLYISNNLTANKLPRLKPKRGAANRGASLYGPADSFKNLIWQEFIVADKYFRAYTQNPNIELLEYLIAALYRPKARRPENPKADIREPFNMHGLDENREAVRTLDEAQKYAVLFFYIGCYNEMKTLYPFVFPEDEEKPKKEEAEESAQIEEEPARDWLDFIRTLPNEKFGTIAQLERAFVHDTLYIVDKMLEDAERQKAKSKKL